MVLQHRTVCEGGVGMAFHIGLVDGQLGFEGPLLRYVDFKLQRILPRSIYSKGIASLVNLQRHL
ncbi:hypothetical protein D3C75_1100670 [compost metagenome]